MTGATGFIGKKLAHRLKDLGHDLVVLSRDPKSAQTKVGIECEAYAWDASSGPAPREAFANVEAVIHLAGEPIPPSRWNDSIKQRIFDSRIKGTNFLLQTLNQLEDKPKTFISTSAIGYYGNRGDASLSESEPAGKSFLARVCEAWEREARKAQVARTAIIRIGIVLGKGGGALDKMLPIFAKGLGGPIGDGQQWMSWIHLDDLVDLFVAVLQDSSIHGVLNAVAPHPTTNETFATALGHTLHRPTLIRVPAIALKLALGEMAEEMIFSSAKVFPTAAERQGFQFKYPYLDDALKQILS